MQPYFVPYAGYFRLFAASDLFVIYDCVQFPRRGWVHRNRLVPLRAAAPPQHEVIASLLDVRGTPVDYLERLLHATCDYLGLRWRVVRSSTLHVPETLRGQERIIEIARRLRATRYVNSPGGREMYQSARFEEAGLELRFLESYEGPKASIAQRILEEDRQALSHDIFSSSATTA
jgi:hypothetical protein